MVQTAKVMTHSECSLSATAELIVTDVRILRFCVRRIGQLVQNSLSCEELTNRHRNFKILQILFTNVAVSLVLTAASASTKHFGVKVTKY